MRLTVIGCSGSFPGPDCPASCYLIEAEDPSGRTWRVVVDLGSGALGPLQRVLAPADVDAVLLSHLHPDHFLDLCGLYVALRYCPAGGHPGQAGRHDTGRHDTGRHDTGGQASANGSEHGTRDGQQRLPVYGPAGCFDRLWRAYGAEESTGLAEVFDVRQWQARVPVRIGPLTVTPFPVLHPVETYGLRIEHDGQVLAYTGDTDSCPELVELASGADLFLAEASFQEGRDLVRGVHLTGLRAGQAAEQAGVHRLLLTHLPVWTDAEVVRAEADSVYSGSIEVVLPGQVFELAAGRAARADPASSASSANSARNGADSPRH